AWACFAKIPAVGRDRERLRTDDLAPDPASESKAVAADALQAGLVVVRRAEPAARNGNDGLGIGAQSTDPSCPPSFVAYRRTASCPGMCGKPRKFTTLANFALQVSMRLSQPARMAKASPSAIA